ncbi:MAG: hypothetical protein KJ063_23140 [Anaerolineae bacterium]|nr:hypothetical protein [Anaerolineae bacterium]
MVIHLHDYDSRYHPAMPVIAIQLHRRNHEEGIDIKAIVDSGSDGTIIPLPYLRSLKARKGRTRWLSTLDGLRQEINLCAVVIQIGNHRPFYLEVVGMENRREAIIGRDILNQFVVTLNAPGLVVEISE